MPDIQHPVEEFLAPGRLAAPIAMVDDLIKDIAALGKPADLNPGHLEQLADDLGLRAQQEAAAGEKRDLLLKAISFLSQAAVDAPDKKFAALGLKLASLHLHYALEFEDGYVHQGLTVLDKLRGLNPQDARIDFLASQLHLCLGDSAAAEKLFAEAEKKNKGRNLDWPVYAFHRPGTTEELLTERYGVIARFQEAAEAAGPVPAIRKPFDRTRFNRLVGITDGRNEQSKTPYSSLSSETAFWKTAVAGRMPNTLAEFYRKKFPLEPGHKIMSAGSCFAQHIGKALKEAGFNFLDYEQAFKQKHFLANTVSGGFGYELYSARYGNIYTARQLWQLFLRSFDLFTPAEEFWVQNGRWFDPFRPTIEPDGFHSLEEARAIRQNHLAAVKRLFLDSEILIFTLGLTEAWRHKADGAVYPVCPGVAAGTFDPEIHEFKNFSHDEVVNDLENLFRELRSVNPGMRFLLTVSPVPLTATAGGEHILTAVMKSKSILRAAAATVYDKYDFVDYFPSYDVISSIAFGRGAFAENLREVKPEVVKFIMSRFLEAHGVEKNSPRPAATAAAAQTAPIKSKEDEFCDEVLLEAYNK